MVKLDIIEQKMEHVYGYMEYYMNRIAKWLLLLGMPLLLVIGVKASEPKPVGSARPPLAAAGWVSSVHVNPAKRLPSLGKPASGATSPKAAEVFTFTPASAVLGKEGKKNAELNKPTGALPAVYAAGTPTCAASKTEVTSPPAISPAEPQGHERSVSQSTSALTARAKCPAAAPAMPIAPGVVVLAEAAGAQTARSAGFMAVVLEGEGLKQKKHVEEQNKVAELKSKHESGHALIAPPAPAPLMRSMRNIVSTRHERARSSINKGYTLIQAVTSRNTPLLEQLVASGYLVNSTDDDKNTALNVACEIGNESAALFLLGCPGINVNLHNAKGETPLISLVHYSRSQAIFDVLITKPKLELTKKDTFGQTALDYATDYAQHLVNPLNKLHAKAKPASRLSTHKAEVYAQTSDVEGLLAKPTGCCG